MTDLPDRGRAGISWDTFEGLTVQTGILAYTAVLLGILLVAVGVSWVVFAGIVWFSRNALSEIATPVPDSSGASRGAREVNRVLNAGNKALVYVMSGSWYASALKWFALHLVQLALAALVAVVIYFLSVAMAFSYLYCVNDDRAEPQFRCASAEAERSAPFEVFGRVYTSVVEDGF